MNIFFNGKEIDIKENLTLSDFINEKKLNVKTIVCELNLEIVKKEDYNKTFLKEGDKLEIITIMGGG